ncbi:hypothetical protein HDU76_009454 [Blyttiomyces sp. JEL0837]|nr:hypothetical protein HDU76_009454 [Blyttiomyces sp. JEL0837]
MKQLDDAKRDVEARRARLEKDVKAERAALKKAVELVEERKAELAKVRRELGRVGEETVKAVEASVRRRSEIEELIRLRGEELARVVELVEERKVALKKANEEVLLKEAEVAAIDKETIKVTRDQSVEMDNQSCFIDEEMVALKCRLGELMAENQRLEVDLVEENRIKIQLVTELARARREAAAVVASIAARQKLAADAAAVASISARGLSLPLHGSKVLLNGGMGQQSSGIGIGNGALTREQQYEQRRNLLATLALRQTQNAFDAQQQQQQQQLLQQQHQQQQHQQQQHATVGAIGSQVRSGLGKGMIPVTQGSLFESEAYYGFQERLDDPISNSSFGLGGMASLSPHKQSLLFPSSFLQDELSMGDDSPFMTSRSTPINSHVTQSLSTLDNNLMDDRESLQGTGITTSSLKKAAALSVNMNMGIGMNLNLNAKEFLPNSDSSDFMFDNNHGWGGNLNLSNGTFV